MSTMVAGSLLAIDGLDRGSTEVLETTADDIGEARPTRDELAASISEEDPDDGSIDTPDPDPVDTYSWDESYEGIIQTANGLCIVDDGGEPKTADCSTSAGSFNFFDNLDDDTDQVQIRLDGLCVTRVSANAPTTLAACQDGNDGQMWLQTASGSLVNAASPATAASPGECLDVEGGLGGPGSTMLSYECHGNSNQAFSFPGPYVPPIIAVLSVDASSATVSAPMQLAGDGTIFTPEGTGRSLDSPDPSLGSATFTFTVETGGEYKIDGLVYAETVPNTGNNDSFWITTNIDGVVEDYKWGFGNKTSLASDFVNDNNGGADVVIDVPAGTTFTIQVSTREDGAHLQSLTLVPV